MSDSKQNEVVTAVICKGSARKGFLPSHFGKHFLRVENVIYNFAKILIPAYSGGFWEYFELSNGGAFLVWDTCQNVDCISPNGYSTKLSIEAASIVVCLFTFCYLAEQTEDDLISQRYHDLREFVRFLPEATKIYNLID